MGPMRVARLINKRYNHNRKQNSTAAAGSANSPPPAAGDAPPEAAETLHRRDIIPISPPQGKRIFRTARDYYSLCSAFLFPNIFYKETKDHEKAKAEPSPSRRAPYGALVGSPANCTRPRPARHSPVVIVSNDLGNASSPVVSVVPCTTQRHKPALPTHVYLRGYGLSGGSIAMCEQVMPLDKSCLLRHIGTVYGWYDRLAIQHALATQLGIDLCINLAA